MDFVTQTHSMPDQLRWATEVSVPELPKPDSVLVAGMGGSGISGDFASVLAAREGSRLDVVKGYDLPGWAAEARPLVVALSYSGNTEETLSLTAQARGHGLDVVGISSGGALASAGLAHHVTVPGGNQPRASLGYLLGTLCRVLEGAGVLSSAGLAEAAEVSSDVYQKASPHPIDELVDRLTGKVIVALAGSPLTAPVAQRWKTQINENAKAPAWWSSIPEANHNEIVGWGALPELTSGSVVNVPLRDHQDHPRVATRMALTAGLTAGEVGWVDPVESTGSGPLARMLSLAAVADMVTLGLADRYRVDPESVAVIEDLKVKLKES